MRYVAKGGTLIALPLLQRPWFAVPLKTVWPSGLRRWLQAPVRKGVGSNPTAVTLKAEGAPVPRMSLEIELCHAHSSYRAY